jgi:hypothetical protein
VAGSATDAGMLEVAATIIATRNGVMTIKAVMPIPASATATREEENRIADRSISRNSLDRGDVKDGFGKGLRGLLWQIVTDAARDDSVNVFA